MNELDLAYILGSRSSPSWNCKFIKLKICHNAQQQSNQDRLEKTKYLLPVKI